MALRARSYRSDHQIPKLAKQSAPEWRVSAKRAAEPVVTAKAALTIVTAKSMRLAPSDTVWDLFKSEPQGQDKVQREGQGGAPESPSL